jgi:gliding motility-associated-like protein
VSISITAVDSVNCFNGSDGSITTAITGGSGGIQYNWNDAAKQTTSKAVGLQKGTYKVIAKDIYGCSDSTTATVNEPAKVVVSLIENDSVNCFNGSDGRLSANISGGSGGYRYQWNDPLKRQSSSINNLKKGSYQVVVKDLYGCTDSLVAMMNEPAKVSISITAVDSVNCFNGSDGSITTAITGGSGGIQYNWNDAAKQTTSKAVGLQKGTYKVIAKDIYGCSDSATATVNEPAKVSISITAVDSVNCFNGSDGSITTAIKGGSGGIQYSWNDVAKQTTSKAVNLKKGTYKVIAKDIYGCSDSAIAVVKEPLKVSISITKIDSVTCYRYKDARIFTQTKGGTGKYSWTWDDSAGQITANAVGLKKGTYKVLVKDVYGCKDSLRVTLGEPLEIIPKIIANRLTMKDKFTNINSIVNPGGQYTYSWTPSSLFAKTSGNTSQKVIINDSTRVFLNVTDSKGCLGKDSFDIIVVQSLKDIIPNAFTPTGDGLNEVFGLPDIFEIQTFDVYDRWGGLIFRGGPNQPKWNGKIGAELVPAGNYAYTISAILKGTGQNVRHAGTVILIR